MDAGLEDFLTRLNATATVQETWRESLAYFQSQGFDTALYAALKSSGPTMFSNLPLWFMERYVEQNYGEIDPSAHHCRTALTPRLHGLNTAHNVAELGAALDERQWQLTHEAADAGIGTGLLIPLRCDAGEAGGISLNTTMGFDEFRRFAAERKLSIHLAAMHVHARILAQQTAEEAAGIALTPREREALLWTAKGLSSKGVGRKMGITPKAVDFHIANALDKLGAATRAHAVARAIMLRLIEP